MPQKPVKPLGVKGQLPPKEVGFEVPGVSDPQAMQKTMQTFARPPGTTGTVSPQNIKTPSFQKGINDASKAIDEYSSFMNKNLVGRIAPGASVKGFVRLPYEFNNDRENVFPISVNMGVIEPNRDVYVPMYAGETKDMAVARYKTDMEKWHSEDMKAVRGSAWLIHKISPEIISRPLGLYKKTLQAAQEGEPILGASQHDLYDGMPGWHMLAFMGGATLTKNVITWGGRRLLQTSLGQQAQAGMQSGVLRSYYDAISQLPSGLKSKYPNLIEGKVPRTTQVFDWVGFKLGMRQFNKVRPQTIRNAEQALDSTGSFMVLDEGGGVTIRMGTGIRQGGEMAEKVKSSVQAVIGELNAAGAQAKVRLLYGEQAIAGGIGDMVAGAGTAAVDVGGGALFGSPEEQEAYRNFFPEAVGEGLKWGAGFGLARLLGGFIGAKGVKLPFQALGPKTVKGVTPESPPGFKPSFLLEAASGFKAEPPPPPKLLGQGKDAVGYLANRKAGPPGPRTPDVGWYNKPLKTPLAPVEKGSPRIRSLASQVAELNAIKRGFNDPKDLAQLHNTMENLTADQQQFLQLTLENPELAGLVEQRNKALSSRVQTLKNLVGKSLAGASEVLGINANVRLHQPFLNPQALTLEPQIMGMLEWGQGLSVEAGSRGVVPAKVLGDSIAPQGPDDISTMTARSMKLMQEILKDDPLAAVGPPDSIAGTMPQEVKGIRSLEVTPNSTLGIRDSENLSLTDAPTAVDLAEEPHLVREQMQIASKLASGQEEQVGTLRITEGEPLSTDSGEVPIVQDRSGRLFAEVPDPDGEGSLPIEVTDDLTRAALYTERPIREADGSYTVDPIKWEFHSNPLSSVAYGWDKEYERFFIDQEATAKREPIQTSIKNDLYDNFRVGISEPYDNAMGVIDSLSKVPPKTIHGWDQVLQQVTQLRTEHIQKHPLLTHARNMAPTGRQTDVLKTYGDMLSDYQALGSMLEAAHSQVLDGKALTLERLGLRQKTVPVTEDKFYLGGVIVPETEPLEEWLSSVPTNYSDSETVFSVGEQNVVTRVTAVPAVNPVFNHVKAIAKPGQTILDFGAGKEAKHTVALREEGHSVTAHELPFNFDEKLHNTRALNLVYDIVMAGNVLQTQPTFSMLRRTLRQLHSAVKVDGKIYVNYPKPRKINIQEAQAEKIFGELFEQVKLVKPGVYELSQPKQLLSEKYPEQWNRQPLENIELPTLEVARKIVYQEPDPGNTITDMAGFPTITAVRQALITGNQELQKKLLASPAGRTKYQQIAALDEIMPKIFHELNDPGHAATFRTFLALTSEGTSLAENFDLAVRTYDSFLTSQAVPALSPAKGGEWPNQTIEDGINQYANTLAKFNGNLYATQVYLLSKGKKGYGAEDFGPEIGEKLLAMQGIRRDNPTSITQWAMGTYNAWLGMFHNKLETDSAIIAKGITRIGERLGLSPQDAQAALWYYENELHKLAGATAKEGYTDVAGKYYTNLRSIVATGVGVETNRGIEAARQTADALGSDGRGPGGSGSSGPWLAESVYDGREIFKAARKVTERLEERKKLQREVKHLSRIWQARAAEIDRSTMVSTLLGWKIPKIIEGIATDLNPKLLQSIKATRGFREYVPPLAEYMELRFNTMGAATAMDASKEVMSDYQDLYGPLRPIYLYGRWMTVGQKAIDVLNEIAPESWDESVLQRFIAQLSKETPEPLPDNVTPIHLTAPILTTEMERLAKDLKKKFEDDGDPLAEMRVSSKDGARAAAGMDPRLTQVLGENLYQGSDLPKRAIKELLQNAKDAIMPLIEGRSSFAPKGEPDVQVDIQLQPNQEPVLSITDKGHGISPSVAMNELVDIGGTFKIGTGPSGGFGIAKVAYYMNAKSIDVHSVWEDPKTGEQWVTTLQGSGQEWATPGVGLKLGPDKEGSRLIPKDKHGPTGTTVILTYLKKANTGRFGTINFLNKFREYNKTPLNLEFSVNGTKLETIRLASFKENVTTLQGEGFTATVDLAPVGPEVRFVDVTVLNQGIYQFGDSIPAGDPIKIPGEIVVNIQATVNPDEASYPFRTDREGIKDVVRSKISRYIQQDLVRDAALERQGAYKKALRSGQIITASNQRIFDPNSVIPEELIATMARDPIVTTLNNLVKVAHNEIQKVLTKFSEFYPQGRYHGISLSSGHLGANVDGRAVDLEHNPIIYNPFRMIQQAQSWIDQSEGMLAQEDLGELFAQEVVATVVHELTHQVARSDESREFSDHLTANNGRAIFTAATNTKRIMRSLGEENGRLLTNLRRYTATLTQIWENVGKGENVLGQISSNLARRKSGPPGDPGDLEGSTEGGVGRGKVVQPGREGASPDVDSRPETLRSNAELAKLRSEALHHAALGRSFSKRPKHFQSLTPTERFDYLLFRLGKGDIVNDAHLSRLSPAMWEERGHGPKYFKGWMPSKQQLAVLKDAYAERLSSWNESKTLLNKMKANVAERETARTKGEVAKTPRLTMQEVIDLDPSHIERIAENGEMMDEWVRGFNLSVDPVRREIESEPEVQRREKALDQIDLVQDLIRQMDGQRMARGPHPLTEPRSPLGGIQRLITGSMGRVNSLRGILRTFGRPFGVLGTRKQLAHPKEYREALERGDLERNVHHILWDGSLRQHQEMVSVFNEFEDLAIAAAHNEELGRALFMHRQDETPTEFLMKLPPEKRYFTTRRGVKKIKIDIAKWLPKLRNLYEDLITRAESSLTYKFNMQAANYKFDGQALEAELQGRQLKGAQALDETITAYEDIPEDIVKDLNKILRRGDKGDRQADPLALARRSYVDLEKHLKTTHKEYTDRQKKLKLIREKGYRKEGYITYIHKLTKEEVKRKLSDPYDNVSRYTSPEVKNHFLDERTGGDPYRDWVTGWFLYIPAMMKTIHLEPALQAVEPKLDQLPSDMQIYAREWVRALKGIDDLPDQMLNKMGFESWAEEPSLLNTTLSTLTGGKGDLVEKIRSDPEAKKNWVDSRIGTSTLRNLAGYGYLTLLGPTKIAKMTMTETGFILREIMKKPIDLPYSVLWTIFSGGEASYDMIREFASWLRSFGWQGPRYYSEATYMGVTDSIHEMVEERLSADPMSEGLRKASQKAVRAWYTPLRAAEFWLRASTYYWMRNRGLSYGMERRDAMDLAAKTTNDLIGQYGLRELTPMRNSSQWKLFWMFLRFPWAKTELLLNDMKGLMSLTGDLAKSGAGYIPGLRFMSGPVAGRPNPQQGDQGTAPPKNPEPPEVASSVFGEWTSQERQSWEEATSPVSEFGSAYPADRTANMRHSLALLGWLMALHPAYGLVIAIANAVFQEEDEDYIQTMIWPFDLSRFGQIAGLFFIENISRLPYLYFKRHAPGGGGLSAKEEKELKLIKLQLKYLVGPYGRWKRTQDAKARREAKGPPRLPQPDRMPGPGGPP